MRGVFCIPGSTHQTSPPSAAPQRHRSPPPRHAPTAPGQPRAPKRSRNSWLSVMSRWLFSMRASCVGCMSILAASAARDSPRRVRQTRTSSPSALFTALLASSATPQRYQDTDEKSTVKWLPDTIYGAVWSLHGVQSGNRHSRFPHHRQPWQSTTATLPTAPSHTPPTTLSPSSKTARHANGLHTARGHWYRRHFALSTPLI